MVAGEIAFESISSLFGHRGGFFGGGGGGFFGGNEGISPGSETIVNNYYGDSGNEGGLGGGDSRFAEAADQDQNISPDIDDERDNSGDDFSFLGVLIAMAIGGVAAVAAFFVAGMMNK